MMKKLTGFSVQQNNDIPLRSFIGFSAETLENFTVRVVDSLGLLVEDATIEVTFGGTTSTYQAPNGSISLYIENPIASIRVDAFKDCLLGTPVFTSHGGEGFNVSVEVEIGELPCLEKEIRNEFNFIRWSLSNNLEFPIAKPTRVCTNCNDVDFDLVGLQRQTQRNEFYTPTLKQNEQYSVFTNWSEEINLSKLFNVKLAFVEECEGVNPAQTFDVNIDVIDGQRYFRSEFKLHNGIQDGFYRLMIFNQSTNQIYFISNIIEVDSQVDLRQTSLIKYRNSDDIDGFKYADLPEYYNKIRVNMYQNGAPIPEPEIESENTITTAEFRYISTAQRKAYPVEVDGYDEPAMRALESFLAHDEIYINNKRYNPDLESLTYEELDPTYPLMYGRFNLFDFGYARKNKYK